MLVIREAQMEAFKEATRRTFEDEMVAHLAEFSPPLFKAIGEEQMRKAVHFGIGRADSHGFTFRGPTRLYLELMLLFGSYFDTDPQYPWAAEILSNRDPDSQRELMGSITTQDPLEVPLHTETDSATFVERRGEARDTWHSWLRWQ